jgi:Xaa-Pro aminopeptidase
LAKTSATVLAPHALRLKALRARIPQLKADSMLVTNLPDVRYLCGFTGSNAALAITQKSATLFTDGRYTAQAAAETHSAKVKIVSGSAVKFAIEWLAKQGSRRCFLDTEHTNVAAFKLIEKYAGPVQLKFTMSAGSPVMDLRVRKDAFELEQMRRAADLGCEVYYEALQFILPGVTEVSVAAHLEFAARSRGAEKMSFDTIIASGTRSSLPHGVATRAKLPKRGFVTLDFGVILNGYCSDMTRTVHIGKALPAQQAAYEAVLAAQEAGVAAVRPGVTCGEVDEAARSVLRSAKLDKWFTHSTGHGVGLEIHEPPRLAANVETRLEDGMVVTIEPGVYLPGKFGIRIEDMVAVTAAGHEVLTTAPKGWTVLA